jgi:hypothetical protein
MMNISVELSVLQSALDTVMRIAPPASGNLSFEINKNGSLTVTSVAELSRCTAVIACDLSGKGEFAVPAQSLRDAIKGRAKLDLKYANSTLTVKSGSYKTDLVTVDVVPQDEMEKGDAKSWKITPDMSDWIKSALRLVALKPTSILSTWMPVGIQVTSRGAFVCCYDLQHMNWVTTKEITGDFECLLPIDTMTSITEVFSKAAYTMQQSDSHVRVFNKMVNAYLSVPDMKEIPTVSQARGKAKEALEAKGSSFTLKKSDLLTFMDNARSIISKERAELVVEADDGIKLSVRTGLGTSKTKVKGKGKGSFNVDYEYLQEMVAKAPEEVQMTVVEKAFIAMKLTASAALVALNQ